jgi:hypothetical protein
MTETPFSTIRTGQTGANTGAVTSIFSTYGDILIPPLPMTFLLLQARLIEKSSSKLLDSCSGFVNMSLLNAEVFLKVQEPFETLG